jgi:anaerobic dimethyl sulfoxide reductase subunit C (anchor subunit)
MQVHWSLVISTACQRAGLGMFVCGLTAHIVFMPALPMNIVAALCLGLLCIGGIASVTHLQTPSRFFNAFKNLGSHLTQEALITPFLGIALLACALQGILFDLGAALIIVHIIAVLLAIAFLVSTGLAYQMRSRPAWNTGFVLGLFLLTAAEAGGLATFLIGLSMGMGSTGLSVAAGIFIVLCVSAQAAYLIRMQTVGHGVNIKATEEPYRPLFIAWLLVGGIGLIGLFAVALAFDSALLAAASLAASFVGIVLWTALFFKGALKVRTFPMYPVDLNLDM